MRRFRLRLYCACVLSAVLLTLITQAAFAGDACPVDPTLPALSLPHLRAALMERQQLLIVALGSSSTRGVQASSLARSYPAVLQAALAKALPDQHVAVINRGISGQDAPRELARMEADAIAVRPQLVIWQIGANAALRSADPAAFRQAVIEGVRRLRAAEIDVVLMDNQRSPRILAARDDALMVNELAEVAENEGASLFSRDLLMSGWEREGYTARRLHRRRRTASQRSGLSLRRALARWDDH